MENSQGFIGVRIGEKAKGRLDQEAKARGVSLNAHVKQILSGEVPKEDDQEFTLNRQTRNGWKGIVSQLEDLERDKARLKEAVAEESGFFSKAPYSLRLSLKACKRAIADLQEELEAKLPTEDVEAVKGLKLDKWGDPIESDDKWKQ